MNAKEITIGGKAVNKITLNGDLLWKKKDDKPIFTFDGREQVAINKGLSDAYTFSDSEYYINAFYYDGTFREISYFTKLIPNGNSVMFSANVRNYGVGVPVRLSAGNYNLSFLNRTAKSLKYAIAWYKEDGKMDGTDKIIKPASTTATSVSYKFSVGESDAYYWTMFMFVPNATSVDYNVTDIVVTKL